MNKQLSLIGCLTIALTSAAYADVHAFIWESTTGMRDLGALGDTSIAFGINNSGEVVGFSYLPDGRTIHMVTWTTGGGITDLGSIDNSSFSQGLGINSAGNIVGVGYDANGTQVIFFWSASTGYVSLGEGPASNGHGNAINDGDVITGEIFKFPARSVGYVWQAPSGRRHNIGILAGGSQSTSLGINKWNHITGAATLPNGAFDAIVWTRDEGMRDIGTVQDGVTTTGVAINVHDEVVGYGGIPRLPFYWKGATGMILLRTLGGTSDSSANAINDNGVIAGYCSTSSGTSHATLWSGPRGIPQDLGTLPGGTYSIASGINDFGQVVGSADVP